MFNKKLALAYDLVDYESGQIMGHVDTSPWLDDFNSVKDDFKKEFDKHWKKIKKEAEKKRGKCSNMAYRIKTELDQIEKMIEKEEDPDDIRDKIKALDRRYENIKSYWNKKIDNYS